jgi:acetate kinase
VDAIAFTGGVGEHSAMIRHRCLQGLEFLGAMLDEERNRNAAVSQEHPVLDLATGESRVRLLVVRADEELAMTRDAAKLLTSPAKQTPD